MRRVRRVLSTLFLALAAMLGAFGYWGLLTEAGRHAFDEMDGIFPFYAGILAILFFLIFLVLRMLRR